MFHQISYNLWNVLWNGAMATSRISPARLRNPRPGKYCDGGGLWLYVKKNRQAYWVFRYRFQGKDREMSLGPLRDVDAEKARDRARRYRQAKAEGRDPMIERRREKTETTLRFLDAAGRMIETKRHEWRNEKHAQQWENTLEQYAKPVIGELPVDEISTDHILAVLEPIWTEKTETATRLRQRIEAVLDWAGAREYRQGENPARWRGHLDKLLPKPTKVKRVRHHPALPYADLPAFMKDLAKQEGIAAKALAFTILTAARTSETIKAVPMEVSGKVWTVPADRMKAHRIHRVPLSRQAQEVLDALPEVAGTPYLFPGARTGNHLSNAAMMAVLKRMGHEDLTVHGFRSTFRDWCAEQTNFPRELAEGSLAHVLRDVTEAAYRRGDMIDRRAKLMQAWADYCLPESLHGVVLLQRNRASS